MKYLFFILMSFSAYLLHAQSNLSHAGTVHLRAAEQLKTMAVTNADKLKVVEEYEQVMKTDSLFADVYREAARICLSLTPEFGKTAYDKAWQYFNKYKTLVPSASIEVDADLIVLDAMLRKYSNGPAKLNGIWGQYSHYSKTYTPWLEIQYDNQKYVVKCVGEYKSDSGYTLNTNIETNGTMYTLVIKTYHDNRPALKKKGWKMYVGKCDHNAAPGFPTYGEYNHNESYSIWYYSVDLSVIPLFMKCEKISTDYYLNGEYTYSDIDVDELFHFDKELGKM